MMNKYTVMTRYGDSTLQLIHIEANIAMQAAYKAVIFASEFFGVPCVEVIIFEDHVVPLLGDEELFILGDRNYATENTDLEIRALFDKHNVTCIWGCV